MPRYPDRTGFTLLELLIVLVIGGILTSLTIRSFSQVHGSLGTSTAQSAFTAMHAQARALAVERGERILFVVDPETGVVSLEDEDGASVQSRNFDGEYDVSIATTGGEIRLCMTPRGFADPRCGNVSDRVEVRFTRGDRTRTLELLPLGQVREI